MKISSCTSIKDDNGWLIPFFFFLREFQFMTSAPDNSSLSSSKTPISFWCRRKLNPKSLIQPLEILPMELTGNYS